MDVIIRCDCGHEARIVPGSTEAARFISPLRMHDEETRATRLQRAVEKVHSHLRCSACGRKGGHEIIEPDKAAARKKKERERAQQEKRQRDSEEKLLEQVKADRQAARDAPWQPIRGGRGAWGDPGIDFDF